MTPFLQLALALAVLIAAAKAGGYLSYRLGQPSVLGELFVGLLLGPTLIDVLHLPFFTDEHLPEIIHHLAEVGVLLLMFLAGLELELKDLARTGKVAALSGTMGVVLPVLFGAGVALAFRLPGVESLFIGLILAATSVSISAQTLMELNVLRSRVGISLLGAAIFDDILVVLALSIFTALTVGGDSAGVGQVVIVVLRMVAFLAGAVVLGLLVMPRLSRRVHELPVSQGLIAFSIVGILLYGWAAEVLGGMAAITGSFLAGLVLARSPVKERIESGIGTLAYSLFVPVFFINVGLIANMRALAGSSFLLFLAMTVVAVIGKVLGSGFGASLGGMTRRESLQLGIGMMSRGEVGLIVATVGLTQGIIDESIFSAVVGVVIVTTLLTPPLLRLSFRGAPAAVSSGSNKPNASQKPEKREPAQPPAEGQTKGETG